jgi:hypothetical protein
MKPDANVALRFLLGGATLLVVGIALSATGEVMIGSIATIIGVALLISGLHTFGRAGPDAGNAPPAPSSPTSTREPSPPSPPA